MSYSKRHWIEGDTVDELSLKEKRELVAIQVAVEQRRRELYAISPDCMVCEKKIQSVYEASVFSPVNGSDILLHNSPSCFSRVLAHSMHRLVKRAHA